MAETVEELKQEMVDRYNNLSNDEKDIIGSMVGTEELRVLGKVLGPEISRIADLSAIKTTTRPRKRGLGTR
jgi:hypothetical protein|tara:strand:- start:665 stop:877 length:213 start_codon:yes stop_codon:yes gene_type:complete